MKRILIVLLLALMLGGCAEKEVEERKALEVQSEEAVSRFLNRERFDLRP